MGCNETHRGWVKAFGVIFAVLTAFSFFGVLFYLSNLQMLEELSEDKNMFGEWKIQKATTLLFCQMGPLQFCVPVLLGIHRNPKQKDVSNSFEGLLKIEIISFIPFYHLDKNMDGA